MSSFLVSSSFSNGFVAVGGLVSLATAAYLLNCSSGDVNGANLYEFKQDGQMLRSTVVGSELTVVPSKVGDKHLVDMESLEQALDRIRTKMYEFKQDGQMLRKRLDEDSVVPSKVRDQDIVDMENQEQALDQIKALFTDTEDCMQRILVHLKNLQKVQSSGLDADPVDLKNAIDLLSEILSRYNTEAELGLKNRSKVFEEAQVVNVQTHKAAIQLVGGVDIVTDQVSRILGKKRSGFPSYEDAVDEDSGISVAVGTMRTSEEEKLTFLNEGRETKEVFSSFPGELYSCIPATDCEADTGEDVSHFKVGPSVYKRIAQFRSENMHLLEHAAKILNENRFPFSSGEKVCEEVGPEVSGPEEVSVTRVSSTVELSADDTVNVPEYLDEEVDVEVDLKDFTPEVSAPICKEFWLVIFIILCIFLCINVYVMTLPSQTPRGRGPRVYVPPVWAQEDYLKFAYIM